MRFVVVSLAILASLANLPSADADDAQRVPLAPNSVYVEAFGAGLADSLNYERMVADQFALRAGVGLFGAGVTYANGGGQGPLIAFPITVSYVGVRAHAHALESEAG
ncbi:MAG: hypothetical protein ACRENE_07795 [Polyangiaceae bacterium]